MSRVRYSSFRPERYERELTAVIGEIRDVVDLDERALNRILRRYPKDGVGLFSKSEIVRGFHYLREALGWTEDEERFLDRPSSVAWSSDVHWDPRV